jgi:hypothetical protein
MYCCSVFSTKYFIVAYTHFNIWCIYVLIVQATGLVLGLWEVSGVEPSNTPVPHSYRWNIAVEVLAVLALQALHINLLFNLYQTLMVEVSVFFKTIFFFVIHILTN